MKKIYLITGVLLMIGSYILYQRGFIGSAYKAGITVDSKEVSKQKALQEGIKTEEEKIRLGDKILKENKILWSGGISYSSGITYLTIHNSQNSKNDIFFEEGIQECFVQEKKGYLEHREIPINIGKGETGIIKIKAEELTQINDLEFELYCERNGYKISRNTGENLSFNLSDYIQIGGLKIHLVDARRTDSKNTIKESLGILRSEYLSGTIIKTQAARGSREKDPINKIYIFSKDKITGRIIGNLLNNWNNSVNKIDRNSDSNLLLEYDNRYLIEELITFGKRGDSLNIKSCKGESYDDGNKVCPYRPNQILFENLKLPEKGFNERFATEVLLEEDFYKTRDIFIVIGE